MPEHYQPIGAKPSLIREDYGLILDAAAEELVPTPLANLVHERLTAKGLKVGKGGIERLIVSRTRKRRFGA